MKPATALDMQPETRTISAAEFKAKCLQLMDEVKDHKLKLVITKRGKPVAEMSAPKEEEKPFRPLWGRSPNVRILGDIVSPLEWPDPVEKWKRVQKRKKK